MVKLLVGKKGGFSKKKKKSQINRFKTRQYSHYTYANVLHMYTHYTVLCQINY